MRKFTVALLFLSILLIGCSLNKRASDEQSMPPEKPQDFGFVLSYGFGGKNKLDTIKGEFTKDLIQDGTTKTLLKLTDAEMNKIYQAMNEINVMDYPEVYKPRSQRMVMPHQTYELMIKFEGVTKKIYWEDETQSDSDAATRLRNLIENIRQMVESKDEYKKLPPMKGAYL